MARAVLETLLHGGSEVDLSKRSVIFLCGRYFATDHALRNQ